MTLKAQQPNKEGLTFEEWLCAAAPDVAAHVADLRCEPYRKYTEAWLAGEDPTEWRAAAQ